MRHPQTSSSIAYRWLGRLLALAAIAFLLTQGWEHRQAVIAAIEGVSVARFGAALLLYTSACLLLSLAWPMTLRTIGHRGIPLRPLAALHLQAQLAKYLPGGVFHFAHRHGGSLRWGLGHSDLALALAAESLLLLGTASLLAVGISGDARLQDLPAWLTLAVWMLPLMLPAAWCVLQFWSRRRLRQGFSGFSGFSAAPLLSVIGIDLAFFVLSGAAFVTLGGLPGNPAFWLGWLATAWICGYVVPGAPGGIGIRETVLVLGLANATSAGDVLGLALAFRIVTMVADAMCSAVGYLLIGRPGSMD